jgi:predicted MPP superfamily phosphohydrolase
MIARYLINYPLLVDLLWLVVVPLLFVGIGYLLRKKFRIIMYCLAGLTIAAYLYGKYVGARQLEVRTVELSFPDLPEAFDGYRIVQFSDLHVGSIDGDFLRRVVDSINAQHPDLIVFTGDMQNAEPSELDSVTVLPQLRRLEAKDGVCAVLGNHDYGDYTFYDEKTKVDNRGFLMTLMQDMDWYVLTNDRRFIRRDGQRIVIAGMENDGEGRFPQLGNIQMSLYGANRNDFVVMLEHDPTAWRRKILRHCHAQLTLSGHTHGGQFSVFGWTPASLHYRECMGVYEIGGRYIHVTKGLSGGIPVRIGATPEVVAINLRKAK